MYQIKEKGPDFPRAQYVKKDFANAPGMVLFFGILTILMVTALFLGAGVGKIIY